MTRKIIFTTVTFSLATVLSAAALAQQGASAGGGTDEPPVRARGGGGGGMGGGGGGGGMGGGAGAVGGGGGFGGAAAGGGGMGRVFVAHPRVQIGIAMDRVPEPLAAHLNIDASEAILIVNVVEGGPAEQAGVKRFDIITHVEGKSPVTPETIRKAMQSKEPGEAIALRILRGGATKEISVTLAEPPAPRAGAWGNIYLTPEQQAQVPPHTIYLTPEQQAQLPPHTIYLTPEQQAQLPPHTIARSNVFLSPEHARELRQQFRQQWREHQPEIEEHLRRLREEAAALRETLGKEWREQWREFRLDEASREKLGTWLEGAAERTAIALERLAEALEGVQVEVDIQPPRIDIFREGAGVRGMVVHPDGEARQRRIEREERIEREQTRRPAPEMERRLSRLEERLERMERMMRRLLERDGAE